MYQNKKKEEQVNTQRSYICFIQYSNLKDSAL